MDEKIIKFPLKIVAEKFKRCYLQIVRISRRPVQKVSGFDKFRPQSVDITAKVFKMNENLAIKENDDSFIVLRMLSPMHLEIGGERFWQEIVTLHHLVEHFVSLHRLSVELQSNE